MSYINRDGKLDGLAVRTMAMLLREAGYSPQQMQIMAWPRAHKTLDENGHALALALVRSPERETKYLWIGPYYESKTYLYGLANNPVSILGPDDFQRYRYGVKRGAADELFLLQMGVPRGQIDGVDEDI